MKEFDLIERYFAPLSKDGLTDDGCVIDVSDGYELAVSTDVLNEGVHFPFDTFPEQIARKALRANLSDLASMGAEPLCYQLGLALPVSADEAWIAAFSEALAEEQAAFGLYLSGGDTTSTKAGVSVSITIMGLVPKGAAVRRSGARAGDLIVLSGAVGDAFIGLKVLRGEVSSDDDAHFRAAYYRPHPRVDMAARRGVMRAAADISDGLLADTGHIAKASGVRAVVEMEKIVFSEQAQRLIDEGAVRALDLLCGGDDYELVMAVAPEDVGAFEGAQVIGRFESGAGLSLIGGDGEEINVENLGWTHF